MDRGGKEGEFSRGETREKTDLTEGCTCLERLLGTEKGEGEGEAIIRMTGKNREERRGKGG